MPDSREAEIMLVEHVLFDDEAKGREVISKKPLTTPVLLMHFYAMLGGGFHHRITLVD